MGTLLINNASVVLPDKILEKHSVLCEEGTIIAIAPTDEASDIKADETAEVAGNYIAPGFIDLHLHGTGNLLAERGSEDLDGLCRILPQYGVTGFLPAICPRSSGEEDMVFLSSLAKVRSEGTNILGFLLEGHFLALTGAIKSLAKNRSVEQIKALREAALPCKAIFCISPEIDGIGELLPAMTDNGAVPAFITHTAANPAQTEKAITLGAVHATHFYDVFPYPGEKDPGVRSCGVVEAVMANPNVSVDFILDGEHADPIAVKMALACKGDGKVCLITDANLNAGMAPGRYETSWGYDINVAYEGGPARCAENGPIPGALAGSGITMDRAVRNAVKMLRVDIPQAVRMASSNPAGVLGISDKKGYLKEGCDADMVMLDTNLTVEKCWVKGKCRYCRQSHY